MTNIAKIKKEVSCKALSTIFFAAKEKNIDLNLMTEGVPYELSYLLNKYERIEWWVWCKIISNSRKYFTQLEYEKMGVDYVERENYVEGFIFGFIFYSVSKLTNILKSHLFRVVSPMFSCINQKLQIIDKNHVRVEAYLDHVHEPCPEFFFISKGVWEKLGKKIGKKGFKVDLTITPRGAILDVAWNIVSLRLRLLERIHWLFNIRKAFWDLTTSHEELLNQYNKLEESKRIAQRQTTQLKTAYDITKDILQSFNISDTLNAINKTLVDDAEFSFAHIKLIRDAEGNAFEMEYYYGDAEIQTNPILYPIVINNEIIGELIIKPKLETDLSELEELLNYLLPIINISIHYSLALRAITDYKNNLERKIDDRTVELIKAQEKLSDTINLLKIAQQTQNRFFANISHEFRTPLTLILGMAEKIISSTSDDIIKDTAVIKRNSNRLLQLINQLLDLSKLESGKLKLEASKGNIVSFVKGVALSFESLAESKDITLNIQSEKEYIESYFDREMMMKILSNILSNAFKFTPEEGKITVAVKETEKKSVEIIIRDTGIGIAPEEIPKLFDRFYQVDSSHTREYEGTGIGLALTKELVELHHGKISVESKKADPGKPLAGFTQFTIELPLGRDHLKDEEIISSEKFSDQEILSINKSELRLKTIPSEREYDVMISKEENAEVEVDKTIILIVEDNYDMREYIKETLTDEFAIEEAVNGEQGVRSAIKTIPDLIISDMMMPKMDGNQLVKILKNDEKTSHIPIIILTAKAGQENKLEGLEIGADDYLIKPFDIKELQVRVKNLINIRKKLQEKYGRMEYHISAESSNPIEVKERKLSSIDERFLYKVKEVIEKHISEEEFSIEEFGNEVGMSRVQLHRKLKAIAAKSASQYLRSFRLSKAKIMLEEKKGNISEIAYSVGFSSPSYFTKCFREEFGFTPSDIND
jgi:signal transduction histidine kinase/DNA-binding response OmpR family regulator